MKAETEALYGFAGTVKALGVKGKVAKVGGIGIPFFAPDCVDDVFTPETKTGLEDRLAVPILYGHGFDPVVRDDELGKIRSWETRDEGIYIEGEMDLSLPHAIDIYELATANELGWSSACVGHLTHRMPQKDGTNRLLKWIIAEWSLTTQSCSADTPVVTKQYHHVSLKEAMRQHSLTPAQRFREESERLLRKARGLPPTVAELRDTSAQLLYQAGRHLGPRDHDWLEDQRTDARQHLLRRSKERLEKGKCACQDKAKAEPQVITVTPVMDHAQIRRDYHDQLRAKWAGNIYADLEIRKALQRFDQHR